MIDLDRLPLGFWCDRCLADLDARIRRLDIPEETAEGILLAARFSTPSELLDHAEEAHSLKPYEARRLPDTRTNPTERRR